MSPKATKAKQEELSNEEIDADITEVLTTSMQAGHVAAEKVFSTDTPTEEMTLGCFDRVFCYDDEDDQNVVIDDLIRAHAIAIKLNASESVRPVTPARVFWVYDQAFDED